MGINLVSELKDLGFLAKGDGLPHFASGTENNKVVFGPLGNGYKILFRYGRKVWRFHTRYYRLFQPVKSTKFLEFILNQYKSP